MGKRYGEESEAHLNTRTCEVAPCELIARLHKQVPSDSLRQLPMLATSISSNPCRRCKHQIKGRPACTNGHQIHIGSFHLAPQTSCAMCMTLRTLVPNLAPCSCMYQTGSTAGWCSRGTASSWPSAAAKLQAAGRSPASSAEALAACQHPTRARTTSLREP